MAETRRNLFKTSILSIFGAMSGAAIVGAAAREKSDADDLLGPILVRPKQGLVVLRPEENGNMRAYDVEEKSGFTLPPDLTARMLIHEKGVVLKPITGSRDLPIHDKTVIKVINGVVSRDEIRALMSDASWTEANTSAWLEHPPQVPQHP